VQAPARARLPAGGLRGGRRARRRVSSRPGLHEAADAAAHVPVLRLPVAGHGDGGVPGPPPGDRVPPVLRAPLRRARLHPVRPPGGRDGVRRR
jgi:hypothetical protein